MLKKIATKTLIAESLIDLSYTRSIEKITVNDIIQNCGIGRQTFYYHFQTKFDLINWFYMNSIDEIIRKHKNQVPWVDMIAQTFIFQSNYKHFFLNAYTDQSHESLFNTSHMHAVNYYMACIQENTGESELDDNMRFAINLYSYGAICICRDWLKDTKESPVVLTRRLADSMPARMREYMI